MQSSSWLKRDELDAEGHGYPRPLLQRSRWQSLSGSWLFALDAEGRCREPGEVRFEATIKVPYAPEAPKSGVHEQGLFKACWYRRRILTPVHASGERIVLHFGAADYRATVWVDDHCVGTHEGGYAPFSFDITERLRDRRQSDLVVHVEDDPGDLAKPRGKQDWKLHPHSIWYPRTSGIWQTVWWEPVPEVRLEQVKWTPSLERWEISLEARVTNTRARQLYLEARLSVGGTVLAEDRYALIADEVTRRIALSDPGIDDSRNELFWSPARPTLIEAELRVVDGSGRTLDEVFSYTAIRSVSTRGDRFVLNGRDFHLRMILDQGYWPETGLTPPSDLALRRDIELTKAMGFNGARKHQKVEDPRYLYWADRLGLLVWEEMPSAYRFTERSIHRVTRQWLEIIERDNSHPCIVAWVPFNESWGVPNLPDNAAERHYVRALYHLTRTVDPTRPVIGNDGWESVATDIIGIHDYDPLAERIARRYATHDSLPHLWKRERPGGRALLLDGSPHPDHPIVLSEFGGLALHGTAGAWGYSVCLTAQEMEEKLTRLFGVVRNLTVLAGFCYTQLTDTYQEQNGLLRSDRTEKLPLEVIRALVTGAPMASETDGNDAAVAVLPAEEDR